MMSQDAGALELGLASPRPLASANSEKTLLGRASPRSGSEADHANSSGDSTPDAKIPAETHAKPANAASPVPTHASGVKLVLIVCSLALTIFCVAIDNTIVATTIPRITKDFHTINDIGWYGTAYLLTNSGFQVLFAKIYQHFPLKSVFLTSLAVFEVGSVVSGAAPSSVALIVGRAISGIGGAGLLIGSTTASALVAPLHLRPTIMGIMGSLFAICNVISPLLGGAFAQGASWRWCFYINLPLGGVAAVGVVFLLHVKQHMRKLEGSLFQRILHFDPLGNVCFIIAIVSLLLALQLSPALTFSNPGMIASLVLFGCFFIAWVAVQIVLGEDATVPPRIHKLRTIRFGAFFGFCMGSSTFVITYYLPTWFQAVKGKSPVMSGVCMLPTIISQASATVLSGVLTTRMGHYMPYVYASAVFIPLGIGLITTLDVDTPAANWIGYQILFGLGVGMGFQQVRVAASAVLPPKDISLGIAFVFAVQFLGGTVFVAAGQNVFTQQLRSNVAALDIPGFNVKDLIAAGAANIGDLVPQAHKHDLLKAYSDAIMNAFRMALVLSCLMILGALGMEWKSVRPKLKPKSEP